MVSVQNTAVDLTVALVKVICLQMLASLLLIYGFQQLYHEVTACGFLCVHGVIVSVDVSTLNSCGKLSSMIFSNIVSAQFSLSSLSEMTTEHTLDLLILSLSPTLSPKFSMSPGFLVGMLSYLLAIKFFLQLGLIYPSFENLALLHFSVLNFSFGSFLVSKSLPKFSIWSLSPLYLEMGSLQHNQSRILRCIVVWKSASDIWSPY